jgi:putative transposase
MCLRFVFLLITRLAAWLRLSRREEAWKTAEILILHHQLAVLQRQQPRRPNLNWADRALLTTLLSVLPKARRQGLRLLQPRRSNRYPNRSILSSAASEGTLASVA